MASLNTTLNAEEQDNKNSSDLEVKNIIIPNSQFSCKWVKEEGYAIGIENVKITKNFETLEEALNEIGYGVEEDEAGDQILVKVGNVDYELFVRAVKAILIIEEQKLKNAIMQDMVSIKEGQI